MTLRRALTPLLPNLDAQLIPYSRGRAGQSAHRPVVTGPPADHSLPSASEEIVHDSQEVILRGAAHTAQPPLGSFSLPRQLPLASEFSVSSIDTEGTGRLHSGAADGSQQIRQQPVRGLHDVPAEDSNDSVNDGPEASFDFPGQCSPEDNNGAAGPADQFLLNTQLQHAQRQGSSSDGVRSGRVSVTTAGTVRRTVITVAELQATAPHEALPEVPPEASTTLSRFQSDHTLSRCASSASASPSQQQTDAVAGHASPHVHLMHSRLSTHAPQQQPLLQSNASLPQHVSEAVTHQPAAASQPAVKHDRALQNSPAVNSAQHRSSSPPSWAKAASHGPMSQPTAARNSEDTGAVLQSQQAIQESAVMSAVQAVRHAEDDTMAAAVQALQLQLGTASAATLDACLPQVRPLTISCPSSHKLPACLGHLNHTLPACLATCYTNYDALLCRAASHTPHAKAA